MPRVLKLLIAALVTAGLLILPLTAATAAPTAERGTAAAKKKAKKKKAKRCATGSKRATVRGRAVCLRAGGRCAARDRKAYKRNGFVCTKGRLRRLAKPQAPANGPAGLPLSARPPAAALPAAAPAALGGGTGSTPGTGSGTGGGPATSPETAVPGAASVTIGSSVLRPGASVPVSGTGFKSGSSTTIELHSTPMSLGDAAVGGDGTFTETVVIPEDAEDGDHHIVVSGTDAAGEAATASVPLVIDVTAPEIVSVTATPATASPGDTIVVTAHVTDASAVRAVGLQASLDGSEGNWSFCDSYATLASGPAGDGTWSMTCVVPDTVLNGDYTIFPYAEDVAGNWANINGGPLDDTRGTFTITGGSDPVAPPSVESITVTPATATPGSDIVVSAHVTSEAGVKMIELQSVLDGQAGNWSFCDKFATLATGTVNDGTWSITCTVPTTVLNGTYTVTPYVQDEHGTWVNTNGGPPDDTRGTFTVTGGLDSAAPADVVSITVTPSSVTAGDDFTVTAHVTSEVGVDYVELQGRSDTVQGNSPFCAGTATRTSGTATDGIWTLNCTVPSTVAGGGYTVIPFVRDAVGNWVNSNGGASDPTRGSFTVG